jgi:hypothetical protein
MLIDNGLYSTLPIWRINNGLKQPVTDSVGAECGPDTNQ